MECRVFISLCLLITQPPIAAPPPPPPAPEVVLPLRTPTRLQLPLQQGRAPNHFTRLQQHFQNQQSQKLRQQQQQQQQQQQVDS